MHLGMIGLGRMGANLVRRLTRDRHHCVAYDVNPAAVESIAGPAVQGAASFDELLAQQLSMRVHYRIDATGELNADNQLTLAGLTLGEHVDSPDATHLPVPLAIALLTVPDGPINLDLPVPGSLPAVLAALEEDHEYLTAGGVFTPDLIETWIAYKQSAEIDPIRLRPHPPELELYYDI